MSLKGAGRQERRSSKEKTKSAVKFERTEEGRQRRMKDVIIERQAGIKEKERIRKKLNTG